ncbi:MAG: error-prone DNA polymerase [Acidimicrobiales bacterium]
MGWRNPPVSWSALEQRLSDRRGAPPVDDPVAWANGGDGYEHDRYRGGGRTSDDEQEQYCDGDHDRGGDGTGANDGGGALPPDVPEWANGGDSPAWSRKRSAYEAPADLTWGRPSAGAGGSSGAEPYAELHCHSNFSFLDGASHPEELAEEAVRLGLEALAITDHDGFYGVVRFAEAARAVGLPTVFGTELTLDGPVVAPVGEPDPPGEHLVILARDPVGYARLARAASTAQLAGSKGAPRIALHELAALADGHWAVLTGCRKGPLATALEREGPAAAGRALDHLTAAFGVDHVQVELWDHGDPLDGARNDALAALALRRGVALVATNNVHYAVPAKRRLATALAAVRSRRSLAEVDGWLPGGAGAHLRSGAEQARRFERYPGVVTAAAELGRACAFDLRLVAPNLPPYPCPDGLDEMGYLRRLVTEGASHPDRYGPRPSVPADPASVGDRAWRQIDHELDVIAALGFPGYFLIVWDIVQFCVRSDIYCQGRGSAANSAACWALGVTKADAVRLGLLFERFLSTERDGPPDIDLDIESGRREEVIQYVYERYGRHYAAQVANVITYRSRSAVRDMAKALGADVGQQDARSKQLDPWMSVRGNLAAAGAPTSPTMPPPPGVRPHARRPGWVDERPGAAAVGRASVATSPYEPADVPGSGPGPGAKPPRGTAHLRDAVAPNPAAGMDHDIPVEVLELAAEVEHFPRHLGIHSGGMVLCDRPVIEVCPVEWATMADRSVLQWDKDDCAAAGLVKFDLLGLGMLTALHHMVDLVREHTDPTVDLATVPQDDDVYAMLCKADSIGVFQVESRAQMATLPRLKPRTFYDLVVEVALIRPGPIQGGSVHPYIRRRNGQEPVTYLHPLLEPSLRKTLGIPLFQEQLMQMAIDVAGFSPGEADQLRQAMGSKRSTERMERLRQRLHDGMAERGITGPVAEEIYAKLAAFANFGFPESHSVSFAYLVYASAWFKLHHPAAFCAGLLNAQPMGFYSPHTLVQDARRHGVEVRTPDINTSAEGAILQRCEGSAGDLAVRLGIASVRGIGDDLAERIAAGRPYVDMEDVARRHDLTLAQLEALATAGAFGSLPAARPTPTPPPVLPAPAPVVPAPAIPVDPPPPRSPIDRNSPVGGGMTRREAMWAAGAVAQGSADQLAGIVTGDRVPTLPGMDERETAIADLWATGVSPDGHPTRFVREELRRLGVVPASELAGWPDRGRVLVGGVVTHRQRPATAGGTTFLNLEDETGLVNVVVSKGCWVHHRRVVQTAPALLIRGRLESAEGVVNIIAETISLLPLSATLASRDFR